MPQTTSKKHNIISSALILIICLIHSSTTLAQPISQNNKNTPPNIILFLVDDLGWQDTSVAFHTEHTKNNDRFRTPNIQKLADRGMIFTDAYAASPVCSPTRTAILTGSTPARSHITDWLGHYGPNNQPKPSQKTNQNLHLVPDWNRQGVTSDNLTSATILRDAGYRTIHIGKAHVGSINTEGADPLNLGFDINIAGHHRGHPGSYYGQDNYTHKNGSSQVPHLEEYHDSENYLNDALTTEANKIIDQAVEDEVPFFLHMAHYAVHTPIQQDPDRMAYYKTNLNLTDQQARYATMIESMDASLGQIVTNLENHNILDNTIIWFHSDNGPLTAHSGPITTAAPLKGGKGTAYEGGYRVPMIISWPGIVEPNSRCSTIVSSDDFFPTILSILKQSDIQPPNDPRLSKQITGESIYPLFTSTGQLNRGNVYYVHYPHYWWIERGPYNTPGIEPFSAIRRDQWKLIYFYND